LQFYQLFNIEDFSFDQRSKEKMKVKHMEEIPQFLHNKPTAFGDFYNQGHTPMHLSHNISSLRMIG
jgi:hypothetical protein